MNRLWYIQIIEYYLALERNKLSSHEKTWGNLKCVLLSERSKSEKGYILYDILQDILEKTKLFRE